MIHYLAIWMLVGAFIIFPFLSSEMIMGMADRARSITAKTPGMEKWSIIRLLVFALLVVVILWPLVLIMTCKDLLFPDDDIV